MLYFWRARKARRRLECERDSADGFVNRLAENHGRAINLGLEDAYRVSDHFAAEAQHEAKTVRFRESERGGRVASADDHEDGTLSLTLSGTSPQCEEDTLSVCRVLVCTLNRIREEWDEPVNGERNCDCVAASLVDATAQPLCIQVVKAVVEPEIWRTLASTGIIAKSKVAVETLTDLIVDALKKKLDPKKIPPKLRAEIVLALDANRLPGLAFDSVVNTFRERHRAILEGTGFRSIWIVGPTESLTKRLDKA
jgi:hypothetical protein